MHFTANGECLLLPRAADLAMPFGFAQGRLSLRLKSASFGMTPESLSELTLTPYEQPGILKLLIRVRQVIAVPTCGVVKYWFTYQKVQSSTGSTVMLV
jgi:hypothetical protein